MPHRRVFGEYNIAFLDAMLQLMAATTIASYAIYRHRRSCDAPSCRHGSRSCSTGDPLAVARDDREAGGSPTNLVWANRPLQITIALSVALLATMLAISVRPPPPTTPCGRQHGSGGGHRPDHPEIVVAHQPHHPGLPRRQCQATTTTPNARGPGCRPRTLATAIISIAMAYGPSRSSAPG